MILVILTNIFVNRTKIALANIEDCYILDDNAPDDIINSQQGCPGKKLNHFFFNFYFFCYLKICNKSISKLM